MLSAPDLALHEGDGEALLVCMDRARAAGRGKQLDKMLEARTWPRVAVFAAYVCQMQSLALGPHESPPCHINYPDEDEIQGAKPLNQMLAAGISKWHPDPMAALDGTAAIHCKPVSN